MSTPLRERIESTLIEDVDDCLLAEYLRQLLIEFDCDQDAYSDYPALEIPPPGWIIDSEDRRSAL